MKLIIYADGDEVARWADGAWTGDIDRLSEPPATDDLDVAAGYVEELDGFEVKKVATVDLPDDDDWMRRGRQDAGGDVEPTEVEPVEELTEEEIREQYTNADEIIESLRREGVGKVANDE